MNKYKLQLLWQFGVLSYCAPFFGVASLELSREEDASK